MGATLMSDLLNLPARHEERPASANGGTRPVAENAIPEGSLRALLEQIPEAVLCCDREWRITYANSEARRVSRVGPGDLHHKTHWELYPETAGTIVERTYRRAIETGTPDRIEYFYKPFDLWLDVRIYPTEEGVALYYRDITEQKRAALLRDRFATDRQHETERQRAELETVYQTAPVGLALFDPADSRCLRLNERQAEILGLASERIVGRTYAEIAPIAGLREMFQLAAAGHAVRNQVVEGELPTRPGERRVWNVSHSPVYGEDGSVEAITAAWLEITHLKKAESALVQSEKLAAVGRLASSISHEINNPLEAITNLLYLIALDEDLPQELKIYVHMAQSELSRVSQIATQTLRFHRQAMKPTWVTPGELIDAVLNLYQGRLANSGIKVEAVYSTHTRVLCFENDIRQVLNNLVANAIDATRGGGRLVVRAHDAVEPSSGRKGVRLTIADTGHGMSRAVRERLFEPFFTTKDLNGTGLGLWISEGIVERHQGRLSVRSTQHTVHHGTVFSLFLPCEEA